MTGGTATATQPVTVASGTVTTVSTVTTSNVVSKNLPAVGTIANLGASATFTTPIIDAGSTMTYTKLRVRIIASHALTVEIRNGTSATATSNREAVKTFTTVAGEPYDIDIPLVARYASVKLTNGASATTYLELHHMLLGQ